MKRRIAILGSTGSIGTQALEVIRSCRDNFEVEVLSAMSNASLLIAQAKEFMPNSVVIADEKHYTEVKDALSKHDIKVFAGEESLVQIVESDNIDMVLAAIVGFAGLRSTLHAIEYGRAIALANKETLVVAGDLITKTASEKGVNIYPVDSEHSAIFQCLAGEFHNKIEKIILTASGGPFRGYTADVLRNITPEQALSHPNWNMGAKITIDSATLMNKGLEVIEAKWLFGLKSEQIEVVIHPQSIIHSLVQFNDGSVKAQMGPPDMKLPIQYALSYPQRLDSDFPRLDLSSVSSLTFEEPDMQTFPCLSLAYAALEKGGAAPCVLNAANEVAVQSFLDGETGFTDIPVIIEECLGRMSAKSLNALDDYIMVDMESRKLAKEITNKLK